MVSYDPNSLYYVKLKSLHGREIDGAEFFCDRRIVIFSTPVVANENSWRQIKQYEADYDTFVELGIDGVYCISSSAWVVPFVTAHADSIVPLHDATNGFLSSMKEYVQSTNDINILANRWQYVVVVDNGGMEKLFSNPTKEIMTMKLYFDRRYQYRGLDAKKVIDYLQSSDTPATTPTC
jgi:peroxiredoxin